MPCSVKINKIFGLIAPGGKPSAKPLWIHVEGSARGCQKVLVNSDCSDPDGMIVPVHYEKDHDEGRWLARLKVTEGEKCECGSDVRVRAIASPYNSECQGVNIVSENLKCREE